MKKILLLLILIGISPSLVANSCGEEMYELAVKHREQVDEWLEDFNIAMTSAQTLYESKQADPTVSFDMIKEIWVNHFGYKALIDNVTKPFDNIILDFEANPESTEYCTKNPMVERLFKVRLNNFHQALVNTQERIEQRIDLEELSDNEGLAIVAAYAYGTAPKIVIKSPNIFDGNINIGPLVSKEHIEIRKLAKGQYQWDRIELGYTGVGLLDSNIDMVAPSTRHYIDFNDWNLFLNVEASKLNFNGIFIFEGGYSGGSAQIYDRLSYLVKRIEKLYPYLIHRLEWTNSLAPNDPFIQFYYSQRFNQGATK
ncbi:hypothetical protein [Alteromonas facilis]|uniref:hypothetical protein n=1 Tax=Alteromonas facilis TaxID=2048004 RepID=UPI000F5C7221|nr:hypothetical protein [Alteromonas facilis]